MPPLQINASLREGGPLNVWEAQRGIRFRTPRRPITARPPALESSLVKATTPRTLPELEFRWGPASRRRPGGGHPPEHIAFLRSSSGPGGRTHQRASCVPVRCGSCRCRQPSPAIFLPSPRVVGESRSPKSQSAGDKGSASSLMGQGSPGRMAVTPNTKSLRYD